MPEQQYYYQRFCRNYTIKLKHKELQMKTIDSNVLANYNAGKERNRLRKSIGLIEFERTKELILANLPAPPAVVYDIGGAYGEYSWWLASLGYEVHLFDISKTNIDMSAELSSEYPGYSLKSSEICDARSINRPDKSADAILLMGPLYHITEKEERIIAIKESYRLLKDSGVIFVSALGRYSCVLGNLPKYGVKHRWFEEKEFIEMISREINDGNHIAPKSGNFNGIGTSHFHCLDELKCELALGGFPFTEVHGILGGAWLAPNIDELWKKPKSREALMTVVRLLDGREDIMLLSNHLLGIAKKL